MFGQNEVAAPRLENFKVHSIFYTIQGEGPFVGTPAIFVRFSDCNLRCTFCDTAFTGGAEWSFDALADELERLGANHGCRFYVLTGGEPMLQPIHELMARMFRDEDDDGGIWGPVSFQIETAGTVWPKGPALTNGDTLEEMMHGGAEITIVCSPKTPMVHPHIEDTCVHWKYIIRHGETDKHGLPNINTQMQGSQPVRIFRPIGDEHQIWVQACDEGDATPSGPSMTKQNQTAAVTIALKHGYRLSYQIHKRLGLA